MKEYIPQIIKKHINTTPAEILPLAGGERSEVFRVSTASEDVCLKFHSTDKDRSVLGMEFRLMEELDKLGIQTPKPMYLDRFSASGEEYEYLIMSFEQGPLLSDAWKTLRKGEKEKISVRLLQILDGINNVAVTGYGPINQELKGMYDSPSAYMEYEFGKFENSGVSEQVDKDVYERAKRKLIDLSSSIKSPKYVHADFRLRNFIVNGESLVLFDFANSISMDPTFDFVRFISTDFSKHAELTEEGQFLEKLYITDYYAGDNYAQDKKSYQLLLTLRLSPWFYSMGKEKHLASYLKRMEKLSQ